MDIITSARNKYVIRLRELSKAKTDALFFIVEGMKQVSEITADWKIDSFAVSESFASNNRLSIYSPLAELNILSDSLFKSISDTVNPQGILAVCTKKSRNLNIDFTKPDGLYLLCDRISDPGNMGSIIRNAHAFNCDGLLISEGSVDIYNPKIVRASAGSLFLTPFSQGLKIDKCVESLKMQNIQIITTHPRGKKFIRDIDFTQKSAIILGNEANGVSDFLVQNADELVKIPMPGNSESLNASVAGGIVLYEAIRQRNI